MSVIDRLVALSRRTWKIRRSRSSAGPSWVRAVAREEILCVLLLAARTIDFLRRFGESIGFDAGHHLEVVNAISWDKPFLGVRDLFYGYHPPLGFLLVRTVQWFGFDEVRSAQILAFIASILAFVILRATLRRLKLLEFPAAVAFLYLGAALPIQFYLQMSINLDVLILALASMVLYVSVRIFTETARTWPARIGGWTLLAVLLAAGMMIKYSGLFLFLIPLVVALTLPARIPGSRSRVCLSACMACAIGALLVFPYYYNRYYATERTPFPMNVEWIMTDELRDHRDNRDRDPLHYALQIVSPSPVHVTAGITERDYQMPRLLDSWRDFWIRERTFFGTASPVAKTIGIFSLFIATLLCPHGLCVFLGYPKRPVAWRRLGWISLSLGTLYVAGLAHHLWNFPSFGPSKGIYVAPVTWLVAYLLAESLTALPRSPFGTAEKSALPRVALSVFLALFIGMQVVFPAY